MGEDQDAAGARGLDEADGGDGLAGAGRVLEPEAAARRRGPRAPPRRRPRPPRPRPSPWAPRRARVASSSSSVLDLAARRRPRTSARLIGLGLDLDGCGRVPVPGPGVAVAAAPATSAISAARVPESASTWWAIELGAVGELRLLLGEQPLEPEHQRVVAAPLDRGRLAALVDLGQGGVERAAPGGARRQVLGLLALEQEGLARELAGALDVGARRRLRRLSRPTWWFQPSEAF